MKVEYINPFLSSTINVIEKMAFTKVQPGKPYVSTALVTTGEVTGSIGLAGDNVTGSMLISFNRDTILEIVSKMLQVEFAEIDDDVVDAVGELTNMIVGGAKRLLGNQGFRFDLSLPTMIRGKNMSVRLRSKKPRIVIPFRLVESGKGFCVEAAIEEL